MNTNEKITYPVFVAQTNPDNLPVQSVVLNALHVVSQYEEAPPIFTIDQTGHVEWALMTKEEWKAWSISALTALMLDKIESALTKSYRR